MVTTRSSGDDDYTGYGAAAPCGTSLAAPIVTASAAMVLGTNGTLTNDDLEAVLKLTADDLGSPGRDNEYGHGQVKLSDAIDFVSSPREVYHSTVSSLGGQPFSGTYIGSRTNQEFSNTPFNSVGDTFEPFHVRIYELEIDASFASKGVGETVVNAWAQPRLSTGFPNQPKIDAYLLTSHIETDLTTLDDTDVVLRTYTYKVSEYGDSTSCLGWYPLEVSGAGACGSTDVTPKFDYTFVTEPSSPLSGSVSALSSMDLSIEILGSRVSIGASGVPAGQPIQFELHDVLGRTIRTSESSSSTSVQFDIRGLASGVYWARATTSDATVSRKVVIVR